MPYSKIAASWASARVNCFVDIAERSYVGTSVDGTLQSRLRAFVPRRRLQPGMDNRTLKPVALEVIAQQRRQRGFVFDDQRPKAGRSSRRRSQGRTRLIAHEGSASCANSVRRS